MIVINRVKTLGNGLINGFLFWLFYPFFHVDTLDPILITGDFRGGKTYRLPGSTFCSESIRKEKFSDCARSTCFPCGCLLDRSCPMRWAAHGGSRIEIPHFWGRWKSPTVVVTNMDQVPKMEVLEPQLFLGWVFPYSPTTYQLVKKSSGFLLASFPFKGQQENLMFFFGLPPKIMGIGHICMGV